MSASPSKPAEGQPDRWLMHFEIKEKIGRGAFGTVWKAHDTRLDRAVAIKIPRKERIAKSGGEIFLREARAAAQLKHPNIVPVFEVGRRGEVYYIVSDFIDGIGLDEWLREHRPRPREAVVLLAKIADALEHAHKNGVVHRDLKPTNVLIDAANEPHIMDFGLAKRRDDESSRDESGRIIGTPLYMAPEQARGEAESTDARTDIYALGVVFFELLTGAPPFHGTVRVLLDQIMYDDAPSPRRIDRSIPRDLETICLKCLQKNRMRRYQSAGEVAADLRRWLNNEPIAARPATHWERRFRWAQRNRLAAGLIGTLALIVILATGNALLQSRRTRLSVDGAATAERLRTQMEKQMRDADQNAAQTAAAAAASRYSAAYLLAQQHWRLGDAHGAVRLLEACPIDKRGWEWHHLRRQLYAERRTVELRESPIDMAVSARGVMAAVLGPKSVEIVDVVAGKAARTFEHQLKAPRAIAWHGGVERLAIATASQLVIVDSATGRAVGNLAVGAEIACLAASDEPNWLAVALANNKLQVWQTTSNARRREWTFAHQPRALTFHAIEPHLAVGFDNGTVELLDIQSDKPLHRVHGPAGSVTAVDFTTDGVGLRWLVGNALAVQTRRGAPVEIENLAASRATVADLSAHCCIASAGGDLAVFQGSGSRPMVKLPAHDGAVRRVAQLLDGRQIVSVGDDRRLHAWKLPQNPATIECNEQVVDGAADELIAIAFSDKGDVLVDVGRTKGLAIRDGASGQANMGLDEECKAMREAALAPAGNLLALIGKENGVRLKSVRGADAPAFLDTNRAACGARFSSSGKLLAAGVENAIMLWRRDDDARYAPLTELQGHEAPVAAVEFSGDERSALSADAHGNLFLWNLEHNDRAFCEKKFHLSDHAIADIRLLNDGKRVLAITASEALLARVSDGKVLGKIEMPSGPFAAALDGAGQRIAVAGVDGLIRLWDVDSQQLVGTLGPLPAAGVVIAFSKPGMLAVGCGNGAVCLFDGRE